MKLADFDYILPSELIATQPSQQRDQSRLLVLHKGNGAIEHKHFFDILDYLEPGDLLVANNSKVIPARLAGKKMTGPSTGLRTGGGGKVEIFLSKNLGSTSTSLSAGASHSTELMTGAWECLVKGRVKVGDKIILSDKLFGLVEEIHDEIRIIKFSLVGSELMNELEAIGQIPLPPYIIKQRASETIQDGDKENYQTVYADEQKKGSVAAPTAGLHFTPELISKIKAKGVQMEYLTLHVGLGTFLPVKTDNIEEHQIHSEWAEVPVELIAKIIATKQAGHRVIAVGTTTARTLEFFADKIFSIENKNVAKQPPILDIPRSGLSAWVNIFIYPPYQFKVVDALITNFHLPKSTLLMLVSALAGKDNIDRAYQEAIAHKYRFYSYGDAMLIL
ncbi:MAG: tRNA preQ1(34) S-adenosylmethionine ribosyltransferase-isomerase QueA [Candidatus Falkowbacteria bacterium]